MNVQKALNYSDIYLVPKYSELESRSQADISVSFLGRKFKAPWIPSNMESVLSIDNARWLSENGYFYIMHRFGNNIRFIIQANHESWKLISISIGVKESDKILIQNIQNSSLRVDVITIDIAHGDHILNIEMISFIKKTLPNVKIIAGNVCTVEALHRLADAGADAIKVGIAGGGACSTKNMTGFHIPMFTCVQNCAKHNLGWIESPKGSRNLYSTQLPIIADGGVRENGDIAKALVAGADMVMAGSMFAACIDAPGENIYNDENINACIKLLMSPRSDNPLRYDDALAIAYKECKILKKKYHGSASVKQKGQKKNVEGFEVEIPCNSMTYSEKYQELAESLSSSISYAGGKDLKAFNSVNYITTK